MMDNSFKCAIERHKEALDSLNSLETSILEAAEVLVKAVKRKNIIYWCGNGGSAADCQHYAAELMVRYKENREPIGSVALTTDTSLLTAHSNDFEYETIFSRQISALGRNGDVLVGISTSGNSENVFLALKEAKKKGVKTIGLLGNDGGRIKEVCDLNIIVKNAITASIQECHLIIGHFLCEYIENSFVEYAER